MFSLIEECYQGKLTNESYCFLANYVLYLKDPIVYNLTHLIQLFHRREMNLNQ